MTVAAQLKQTLSGLKGARATLRLYASTSRESETSDVFARSVAELERIAADLEQRVGELEGEEKQYQGF